MQNIEILVIEPDNFSNGFNLCPERSFLQGSRNDIGHQRDIGCLGLEMLRLQLCLQRFNLSAIATENIRHVSH